MSQPLWATPERQSQLVKFAMKYKGACLQGHPLCPEIGHYIRVVTKSEAAWVRKASITTICRRTVEVHTSTPRLLRRSRKRVFVEREELSDLYVQVEEQAIDAWKVEDREARRFNGRTPDRFGKLRENTAPTGEVGRFGRLHTPFRHPHDPIDFDKYIDNRPTYRITGYGVNDKLRRFAKVSIPGTGIIIHVDIANSIQEIKSKTKRKRLRRHGFQVHSIEVICKKAVADWWAK